MRIQYQDGRLYTADTKEILVWDVTGESPVILFSREDIDPRELTDPRDYPVGGGLAVSQQGLIARLDTPRHRGQGSIIFIYDAELQLLRQLDIPVLVSPDDLCFSPDGKHLVTTLYGEGAVILDAMSGEIVREFPGHMCFGVRYSPCGHYIATADGGQAGGELYLLDLEHQNEDTRRALPRPTCGAPLYDIDLKVAFDSQSKRVAFSSVAWGLRGIMVYDVEQETEIWSTSYDTLDPEEELWEATQIEFTPDDKLILVGLEGGVRTFSSEDGTEKEPLPLPEDIPSRFAHDPEHSRIWFTQDGKPTSAPCPASWLV